MAIGAILDYQPLLVASVIERLGQRIGYWGVLGHIFRPFRLESKRAPARLLFLIAHRVPSSGVCRQRWWSAIATVRLRRLSMSLILQFFRRRKGVLCSMNARRDETGRLGAP